MISIITINLNNKDGLKRTIESVINQTKFDIIEYIIIDGGSTDGSVDLIKQYQDKISYWVSEKDTGIYNAMNKGIDVSTGEYSLYLNSGDYFYSNDVIEKIMDKLDKDIVYGNEWKINGRVNDPFEWCKGTLKYQWYTANKTNGYLSKYPDKLTEMFFKTTALPHQSTFIKTELLKKNKYSEEWKLLGDWLWFRERIMVDGVSYKHLPIEISCYGLDGISTRQRKIHEQEKIEYYEKKVNK